MTSVCHRYNQIRLLGNTIYKQSFRQIRPLLNQWAQFEIYPQLKYCHKSNSYFLVDFFYLLFFNVINSIIVYCLQKSPVLFGPVIIV